MYQVLARKYRPQTFNELLGQEAIVTTLKNSLKLKRLAHAYLFSGPRGTGKTSIARVFAKAVNCSRLSDAQEPCNACSSCLEIQSGHSLDVMEIDGASNRGIDDIRKINETVGFTTGTGNYKIYIIDEVHMLTKEAFNALLKTLEEPPPRVMFLFATTELHKVLPTILSRCQRYQLSRIPFPTIAAKLKKIAQDQNLTVEDGAIHLLAKRAEGGLRDAESLFDQIISYHDGVITETSVAGILGLQPKELFFEIDKADPSRILAIANQVFTEGHDLNYFLEGLIDHFRALLLVKLKAASPLLLSENDMRCCEENQAVYTKEGLMAIIEFLLQAQSKARSEPLNLTALEAILLKTNRLAHAESVETLLRKLGALEERIAKGVPAQMPEIKAAPLPPPEDFKGVKPAIMVDPIPAPEDFKGVKPAISYKEKEVKAVSNPAIMVDPTPAPEDFKGVKPAMSYKEKEVKAAPKPAMKAEEKKPPLPPGKLDTLLNFAAIELEGKIIRK